MSQNTLITTFRFKFISVHTVGSYQLLSHQMRYDRMFNNHESKKGIWKEVVLTSPKVPGPGVTE
jgi:hypothetical protein